jgi:hypothetical protein
MKLLNYVKNIIILLAFCVFLVECYYLFMTILKEYVPSLNIWMIVLPVTVVVMVVGFKVIDWWMNKL